MTIYSTQQKDYWCQKSNITYFTETDIIHRWVQTPKDIFNIPFEKIGTVKHKRCGFVYLIRALGTPRFKIGRTLSIKNRIGELKNQSPYPLSLVDYIFSLDCVLEENLLHKKFKDISVHGEWFEIAEKDFDSLSLEIDPIIYKLISVNVIESFYLICDPDFMDISNASSIISKSSIHKSIHEYLETSYSLKEVCEKLAFLEEILNITKEYLAHMDTELTFQSIISQLIIQIKSVDIYAKIIHHRF